MGFVFGKVFQTSITVFLFWLGIFLMDEGLFVKPGYYFFETMLCLCIRPFFDFNFLFIGKPFDLTVAGLSCYFFVIYFLTFTSPDPAPPVPTSFFSSLVLTPQNSCMPMSCNSLSLKLYPSNILQIYLSSIFDRRLPHLRPLSSFHRP